MPVALTFLQAVQRPPALADQLLARHCSLSSFSNIHQVRVPGFVPEFEPGIGLFFLVLNDAVEAIDQLLLTGLQFAMNFG